ncbi:MAG: helix-turn-helix domain-containing protein [Candidatus Lokiarchaeota archaeon]|nr:helix-turn-helix domain-containing protein [Candidatus Lokiarchaeota archaeon]
MNKRNLFAALSSALSETKQHDQGKLTLKSHKVAIPKVLSISPDEIREIRKQYKMSRQEFARYLHTSSRTLENWEQGRSTPNEQEITLLHLLKKHPETLSHIADLSH